MHCSFVNIEAALIIDLRDGDIVTCSVNKRETEQL